MIRIKDYHLLFQFSDVHDDAEMAIEFRRTLRVPDDGKVYVLPPSHRAFPLQHVEGAGVTEAWGERGAVLMPMHPAEAMWIAFSGSRWAKGYPFAVKIAAGKINAISGKPWKEELDPSEHDYIVVPKQPRLDGFCIAKDTVRQFVAMQLGAGYSAEEQLTGKGEHGGLQIIVYPMKPDRYRRTVRRQSSWLMDILTLNAFSDAKKKTPHFRKPRRTSMCLALGGRMKQPIYRDPYGIDAWDQTVAGRCFVALADARRWTDITGQPIPTEPPTAADIDAVGLPWSDYAAGGLGTLPGSPELRLARSVRTLAEERGESSPGPDEEVRPSLVAHHQPGQEPRA